MQVTTSIIFNSEYEEFYPLANSAPVHAVGVFGVAVKG
jgi:hypothetical protein